MSNKKTNNENLLREKLQNRFADYQQPVRKDLWSEIEKQLPEKKSNSQRRIFGFISSGVAAMLIVAVVFAFPYIQSYIENGQQNASDIKPSNQSTARPTDKHSDSASIVNPESDSNTKSDFEFEKSDTTDIRIDSQKIEMKNEKIGENTPNTIREHQKSGETKIKPSTKAKNISPANKKSSSQKELKQEESTSLKTGDEKMIENSIIKTDSIAADTLDEIIANEKLTNDSASEIIPIDVAIEKTDEIELKSNRFHTFLGKGWSISIYSGNILMYGLNEDMLYTTPTDTASTSDVGETSIKHSRPLQYGINIRKDITKNFAIESGLKYTYLYSKSMTEYRTKPAVINSTSKFRYIGIPLKMVGTYSINEKISIYGTLGMMGEKCISGTITDTEGNKTKEKAKSWLWSTNVSTGFEYKFNKGVALFAEPQLNYYLSKDKLETIRKEKTFNIDVYGGIRIFF